MTHDEHDRKRRDDRKTESPRDRRPSGEGQRKGGRGDQRRREEAAAAPKGSGGRGKQDRDNRHKAPRKDSGASRRRPSEPIRKPKGSKIEDRIEYYKQKYGEDFKVSPEMLAQEKPKKKGFLGRLFGSKKED